MSVLFCAFPRNLRFFQTNCFVLL